MKIRNVLIASFFLSCFVNGAMAQQTPCADRNKVIEKLEEKFNEHLSSVGLVNGERGVVEIWYNREGERNWSILLTRPDGMTCLVMSGKYWEPNIELPKSGEPL